MEGRLISITGRCCCGFEYVDGRKVHLRNARATERGKDIHSIAMIFPDVLAPNDAL